MKSFPKFLYSLIINFFLPGSGLLYLEKGFYSYFFLLISLFSAFFACFLDFGSIANAGLFFCTFVVAGIFSYLILLLIFFQKISTKKSNEAFFNSWWFSGAIAIIYVTLIYTFGLSNSNSFKESNFGNLPTVFPGDRVFAKKPSKLERGDLIVFRGAAGASYIARLIGLPGDSVSKSSGLLSVNNINIEQHEIRMDTEVSELIKSNNDINWLSFSAFENILNNKKYHTILVTNINPTTSRPGCQFLAEDVSLSLEKSEALVLSDNPCISRMGEFKAIQLNSIEYKLVGVLFNSNPKLFFKRFLKQL